MIHTEKHKVTIFTEFAKECDKCHKIYHVDTDAFEFEEFHHIRFTGGYDSIFGDGVQIECDLCQHCLKELIDGIYRVIG